MILEQFLAAPTPVPYKYEVSAPQIFVVENHDNKVLKEEDNKKFKLVNSSIEKK